MGKKRMRKRYEASFKAWVALAALKDGKTPRSLASFLPATSPKLG
jgi:hypothetical protein